MMPYPNIIHITPGETTYSLMRLLAMVPNPVREALGAASPKQYLNISPIIR